MEKNYTSRTAVALSSELFAYVCRVLQRLLFEGGVKSKKYGIIITMAFVRLLLLLQLLLSTKNLTFRELKARNSLHFCLAKKYFTFESIAAHDLTQEIQFLEFIGGSNPTHAHSNYLICMCFYSNKYGRLG